MRTSRTPSRGERGMTFPEMLVVFLLIFVVAMVALTSSLAWLNAEEVRSAVYQTQTLLQLARVESVTRNRPCAFVVNTATRRVQVRDLNGTVTTTDDITLADVNLSSRVTFESPDGNPPVTLTDLTGSRWGTTFASDGSVSSGAGVVTMRGKDRFNRISLYAAGGTRVERWDQSAWRVGS